MDKWRWFYLACLFLVIPNTPIHAHNYDAEAPINDPRELVEWCQHEVEQLYLARDQVPRNWRIAHIRKGNYIKVKLTFRINYEDKTAACQIRKGAQRRYAIFQPEADK